MSFHSWLRNLRSVLTTARDHQRRCHGSPRRAALRPSLERLDDRLTPSFSPAADYPAGIAPQMVADFNNDGNLDLATTGYVDHSYVASVSLGNGDGTFQPAQTTVADFNNGIGVVATGDFNGDGKLDLAVAAETNMGPGAVSVLPGNGDGTFGASVTTDFYSSGVDYQPPTSLVVGDFNGDGTLDLGMTAVVIEDLGNGLDYPFAVFAVLSGYGDGSFSVPWNYTYSGASSWDQTTAAAADFNGDGNLDMLVTTPGSDGAYYLLGDGRGNLAWAPGAAPGNGRMVTGDINGDGSLDVVMGNGNGINVLLNDGAGGFVTSQTSAAVGAPVGLGDFDHNGTLDIATSSGNILRGLRNGAFSNAENFAAQGGDFSAAGDFNHDGWLDVAADTNVLLNDHSWPPQPPSTPSLKINDVTVTEGNSGTVAATFTVSLSSASDVDVIVHYTTADGSATAGSDYVAAPGDVTIPAGQTHATFTVAVKGDRLAESNETFAVNLTGATNATIADGQGIGTIIDDEPHIGITDVSVTEGNTGTRGANFIVTLSAPYDVPVTIRYSTTNGTATAGSDYQATSGTLTIPAGQTSGTITVQVNGDRIAESNETFFVNLSGPNYGSISDNQGVGTILDDEPRISISDVSKAEGKKNQTTQFTFTITLSAAYDQAVTLSFKTTDGTAKTGDNDYVAQTGTITFKPGETTKTITIEVKGDSKKEDNEYFYLDLFGNSTNSLFTKSRGTGTILNDD